MLSQPGRARSITSLLIACCVGAPGCIIFNPAFDAQEASSGNSEGTSAASVTDPSSGASASTTAATIEVTTGNESVTDGEVTTGTSSASTGATGPEPASCGDGVVAPDEGCDDGNAANDDGCLNCVVPRTCAEIFALAPAAPSGTYLVDTRGTGEPWPVTCDMDHEGGGWTGFLVQDTCNGHLDSEVVGLKTAEETGIDDSCRPYTEYGANGGEYHYYWDIAFPPGFSAFFLRDYKVQGLGDVELKFEQQLWTTGSDFPNGALSLGDAHDEGPVANWAHDGGMLESFVDGQILPYPVQEVPFALGQSSDSLRIGWGEIGIGNEGLYPWWSGQIFVR